VVQEEVVLTALALIRKNTLLAGTSNVQVPSGCCAAVFFLPRLYCVFMLCSHAEAAAEQRVQCAAEIVPPPPSPAPSRVRAPCLHSPPPMVH
jgi:hypothetical protein